MLLLHAIGHCICTISYLIGQPLVDVCYFNLSRKLHYPSLHASAYVRCLPVLFKDCFALRALWVKDVGNLPPGSYEAQCLSSTAILVLQGISNSTPRGCLTTHVLRWSRPATPPLPPRKEWRALLPAETSASPLGIFSNLTPSEQQSQSICTSGQIPHTRVHLINLHRLRLCLTDHTFGPRDREKVERHRHSKVRDRRLDVMIFFHGTSFRSRYHSFVRMRPVVDSLFVGPRVNVAARPPENENGHNLIWIIPAKGLMLSKRPAPSRR